MLPDPVTNYYPKMWNNQLKCLREKYQGSFTQQPQRIFNTEEFLKE